MFTPEKRASCDVREPVPVNRVRRELVIAAVNDGNEELLATILSKALTGGPATVSPTRLARYLLGQ